MTHLNYKSDFVVREAFMTCSGDPVAIPEECDFTITYRTNPYSEYTASRIGGVYTNCAPAGSGKLFVIFNSHRLGRGCLTRTAMFDYRNSIMPDDFLSVASPEDTGIELWEHESECHGVVECDAMMNYVKGDEGLPPVFVNGTIAAGKPDSEVQLSLTFIGQTPEGNPIYRLDGSIPRGDGLHINGYYNTLDELHAAHPAGAPGDTYLIGGNDLYAWNAATNEWSFSGQIKGKDGDKGKDGLPPVIQTGTIASGTPDSEVQLSFTRTGSTPEGNPVYRVDGAIPKGRHGDGFHIDGYYDTADDLKAAHPTGEPGDMYMVGGADLYTWDDTTGRWIFVGNIKGSDGKDGEDGKDGKDGKNGFHHQFVYRSAPTLPETPVGPTIPPTGWSLAPTSPSATNHVWMSQTLVDGSGNTGLWSLPIRISGLNGESGADSTDIEFIYRQTTNATPPARPVTSQQADYIPEGWTDSPCGVSAQYLHEWVCVRYRRAGVWEDYSVPVIWAKWGEKGMDGDGFEYIYRRSTSATAPDKPATSQQDSHVPSGWSDEPLGVTSSYLYEWVSTRKKTNGTWGAFSAPAIWAKYGRDGNNGQDGRDGEDGKNGKNGRMFNYTGDYDATKTYFGNDQVAQVVRRNVGTATTPDYRWFYTTPTAGSFSGLDFTPPNADKWIAYEGNFESVATALLFAEKALISGFNFFNDRIESSGSSRPGVPSMIFDGIGGKIILQIPDRGAFTVDTILTPHGISWHDDNMFIGFMSKSWIDGGMTANQPNAPVVNLKGLLNAPWRHEKGDVYVDLNGFLRIQT